MPQEEKTYNRIHGEFFGYPECCIKAFGDPATFFALRPDEVKKAARNGFIPCLVHAKQLNAGTIQYYELINDRKCSVPFKLEHTLEEQQKIEEEVFDLAFKE